MLFLRQLCDEASVYNCSRFLSFLGALSVFSICSVQEFVAMVKLFPCVCVETQKEKLPKIGAVVHVAENFKYMPWYEFEVLFQGLEIIEFVDD